MVHRLDYETSGIVLFAFEQFMWEALRNAFREQKVTKIYHAIVYGNPGNSYFHLSISIFKQKQSFHESINFFGIIF